MVKRMDRAVNGASLTEGPLLRSVVRLAWPMVLGNLLQNAFNVVDMIFVGRLGAAAIAAVALSGILMQITWTLLIGVSVGTTAMVARYFGAGQPERAGMAAMQSLSLGVAASILLVLFVNLSGRQALALLGAEGEVLRLGLGYLRIVFDGSFTLILFFLSSAIMRGIGDALSPMLVMAASSAANITLDPLLIFGIWIFPRMGVRGAAMATVVAQGIGMCAGLAILSRGGTRIRLRFRSYRPDLGLIRRMLSLSIPGTIQGAVRSVGSLMLMRVVAGFGVAVVAAYGIGLRLDLIVMMPGWALGAAAATLVGQNLGAGKPERAARGAWIAAGLYAAILAVAGALFLSFSRGAIGLFNHSPAIVEHGAAYLRVRVATYLFLAVALVMASALNGAGDTVFPAIVLAATLVAVQIPLAVLLPRLLGGDPLGVWLAVSTAFLLQGLAMAGWFLRGRWKQKVV